MAEVRNSKMSAPEIYATTLVTAKLDEYRKAAMPTTTAQPAGTSPLPAQQVVPVTTQVQPLPTTITDSLKGVLGQAIAMLPAQLQPYGPYIILGGGAAIILILMAPGGSGRRR